MMRRMAILICLIVLGASVAASAQVQVITRDQLRRFFSSNDPYSQGFQAGYAAGIADASSAAYGDPSVINFNVQRCVQTQPFPTLQRLAGQALRQWLAGNDSDQPGQPSLPGQPGQPGQPRQPGQPGQPGQPHQPPRGGAAAQVLNAYYTCVATAPIAPGPVKEPGQHH